MPQFDIETFIPQLFWLTLLFGGFYILNRVWLLPKVQTALEQRARAFADHQSEIQSLDQKTSELEESLEEKQKALQEKLSAALEQRRRELIQDFQNQEQHLAEEMTAALQKQEQQIQDHETKVLGALMAQKATYLKQLEAQINQKWGQG